MFWRNEKDELENYYSVLIHFTPYRPVIYILHNGLIMLEENGSFALTDSAGEEIVITGSCVCKNDFEILGDVESFIQFYQLNDPIYIEMKNEL